MKPVAAVVLAAGLGKRMGSALPKVLHRLRGLTLVEHLLDALEPLRLARTVVVVGYKAAEVTAVLAGREVAFATQSPQRGTGHAVMQARPALEGLVGTVVVLVGDVPLLTTDTMRRFLAYHEGEKATCTLLTAKLDDPAEYGRVLRDDTGNVLGIVEYKDATEVQRLIKEINSGIIAFESGPLWAHIDRLSIDNAQGEYYLTDLVNTFRQNRLKVAGYCVENDLEVRGVNSPEQLRELEGMLEAGGPSLESR
jgi:UDP-N-acetylglucosamine diphosphorylase/glucosamine-1-phosphate N-acetyltransferase